MSSVTTNCWPGVKVPVSNFSRGRCGRIDPVDSDRSLDPIGHGYDGAKDTHLTS